jgi:hypothetical protein
MDYLPPIQHKQGVALGKITLNYKVLVPGLSDSGALGKGYGN